MIVNEIYSELGPRPTADTEKKWWARLRWTLTGAWPQRVVDERMAQVIWEERAIRLYAEKQQRAR